MKKINKSIIAVLLMTTVLSGCGNSSETSESRPKIKEMPTEQVSTTETSTETTTTEETTTNTTGTEETTETGSKSTTPPVSDKGNSGSQKPKVNNFTMSYIEDGYEYEEHYCFVPEEATELSDDINLGLITVDGKEFDITNLANAYGEEEIKNIFGEQAGLYTTERLIADKVFDDVCIARKGSPWREKFVFGENRGVEEVEVNQEVYGLAKSKGAYDFITAEYVNGWFRGLHSKCVAMNNSTGNIIEQITVNGEVKPFVEPTGRDTLFTENNDKLITYTDKNIAVGDGTTYGDIVAMFGTEPTYVDVDAGTGNIYTYRNSIVTVGFVTEYSANPNNLVEENLVEEEQERNGSSIVAVYMWLND